jgi:hypothetical protein
MHAAARVQDRRHPRRRDELLLGRSEADGLLESEVRPEVHGREKVTSGRDALHLSVESSGTSGTQRQNVPSAGARKDEFLRGGIRGRIQSDRESKRASTESDNGKMNLALRFVRGTGWDSKVIEWGSRSWTSHVELSCRNETFGAQLVGGVKWRSPSDPCYRRVTRAEIWDLEINDNQFALLTGVIHKTNGLPYDWRAIVSFAFGERDWREPDSWFCSEWAAMLLETLGIVKFSDKLPFDRITPRDVYMIFTGLPGAKLRT